MVLLDATESAIVADGRKPEDLPEFNWINTVLGDLKTRLGGAYHAFDFAKYGTCYLGAFIYRFNQRSLYVCSSLQPLSGLAQHVGCGKLKNLSNQDILWLPKINN